MLKYNSIFIRCLLVAASLATLAATAPTPVRAQLVVRYGKNGLQGLSYSGQVLEDVGAYPSDSFHIFHMKSTGLGGNVLKDGQYGWGENNNGRSWNAGTKTWTYTFIWGQITLQYVQSGDTLNLVVSETNNPNSGIVFDGATISPLLLHFPQLPAGFSNASYSHYAFNTTAPSVTTADWGNGEVVSVVADASKPLYSGFQSSGENIYGAAVSSTTPDGLATFQPHQDRPVLPGQTDHFTVSLRFAPSGTETDRLAEDAYRNWAATWPPQLNWTDRRVLGTVYLASSPSGNVNQPAGYPNNPRRYFNDSNSSDFDVTTASGLARFQARILQQSAANVQNLQRLHAQGAVTWDIEGEQYPQETSYVCSPDQIGTAAPEMESIVTEATSRYKGMHLIDAYFKTMTSAGLKVGVCLRPQQFVLASNGTASQNTLTGNAAILATLETKAKAANTRWGATIFYVDSSVESDGAVLDASIFQQAAAALPDSLLMPEESTPKHYAYTAPFLSFIFHGDLGTSSVIHSYYPKAFSVNLINDVSAATLAAKQSALTAAVAAGDILMVHADYWQANTDTVVAIYRDAALARTAGRLAEAPVTITTR